MGLNFGNNNLAMHFGWSWYGLVTETVTSNDDVRPQQSLVLWTSYTLTGEKPHELTRVKFVSFYIISNHFACIVDQNFFFFWAKIIFSQTTMCLITLKTCV